MRPRHMLLNRSLISLSLIASMAAVSVSDAFCAEDTEKTDIKKLRKERAHRKRRIIYDNDGNEPVYYMKAATADELLKRRTYGVVGSQADTIVYCTWSSGFSYFTHDTKVGEVFTCTVKDFKNNKTKELIAKGTDALKIMVDFCRTKDIEIFWSMRMNDTHDAWGGWYSPYMFPPIKKQHPDWLVGSKDKRPKNGAWSAVDYTRPEIRDLAFRFVEEVCRNYDVDGVMLDFLRHPLYFKRHAWGEPCGTEELDMMTDLIRRVRTMADEVGAKRGRPILIATRTPDSVDFARAMGLDIVRWMKDDLIDLLVVSGYFRLNPWTTTVKLAHQYGVPVYPCLSETRIRDKDAAAPRRSLEGYRARAMNVLASGADGVYTFNFFDPNSKLWHQVGETKTLAGLDKVYTTGARGVKVINRWFNGGMRWLSRKPVSPETPRTLEPGKPVTVELLVGEDFAAAKAKGKTPAVTLQLRVKDLADAKDLAVKLNGTSLTDPAKGKIYLEYAVKPALLEKGINHFEITLAESGKAKAALHDLLLRVRYE